MPPPGFSNSNGQERRPGRSLLSSSNAVEKDDFLCKVKYLNRLPDLPADTKFLMYNIDMSPYVKYSSTTLEKEYKRDINCDSDMGMKLNLFTMQASRLNPDDREGFRIDQELCADEPINDQTPVKGPQRIDHGRHVAWLRKSQYVTNDFAQSRAEPSVDKAVKRPVSKLIEFNLLTRNQRADAIAETFEYATNKPKRHPNKPELTVVEECPVFPDFDLAKYPVVIVNFDNDPAPPSIPHYMPDDVMASSMLRGMHDESGNQLVAYFVPTEETMQKLVETRGNVDDGEEYAYKLHREYALPEDRARPQPSKDDTVFAFNMRDGSIFYTELETKVKLIRRARGPKRTKSRLVVRFVSEVPAEAPAEEPEPESSPVAHDEDEEHPTKTPPVAESDAESSAGDAASNGVPSDGEEHVKPEAPVAKGEISPPPADIDEESAKSTSGSDSDSDSSDDAPAAKKKTVPVANSDSDSE